MNCSGKLIHRVVPLVHCFQFELEFKFGVVVCPGFTVPVQTGGVASALLTSELILLSFCYKKRHEKLAAPMRDIEGVRPAQRSSYRNDVHVTNASRVTHLLPSTYFYNITTKMIQAALNWPLSSVG